MHPAGRLLIVLGIFILSTSVVVILFDIDISLGDSELSTVEEDPIFDFSGEIGNITFDSDNNQDKIGWRLYILGN